MKIADFFVEITTKGDIKALRDAVEYQKLIKKQQTEATKERIQRLKKETAETNAQVRNRTLDLREQQKQERLEKKKQKSLKYQLAETLKMKMAQKVGMGSIAKSAVSTEKLLAGMTSVAGVVAGIVVGATALTVAIDKMVLKLAQANQLYVNFQRQTGLNMQSAIGFSGAMMGTDITMSPEDIMANMQTLQGNLTGIEFGMGNVMPYQVLGQEAWGTNASEMLMALRKKLQPYDAKYRTFLLQQMGLDPRLGALADMSDEAFNMSMSQGRQFMLDPEIREDIKNLGIETNKMFKAFQKFGELLAYIFGKALMPFTQTLTTIMTSINNMIESTASLTGTMMSFMNVVNLLLKPVEWIMLFLEDIIVGLGGGKSVTSSLIKNPIDTWKALFEPRPSNNAINNVNNHVGGTTNNNNRVDINVNATDGTSGENIANAIRSSLPFNYANTFFGGSTYA